MARATVDRDPVRPPPPPPSISSGGGRFDPRFQDGGYTLPENPAPDFLALLRQFVAPGLAAVERGLSPDGDPDLPGPLRVAGQIAGKALELTPFPAKTRLDSGFKYETEADRNADQIAFVPGFGAVGTIWKQAGKNAPKVAKAVAGAVDDIAGAAPKVADEIPGFRKTALDKVAERPVTGSVAGAPVADDAGNLLAEAETGFVAQRRGVRSHEQSQDAADAILRSGLNSDEVVALGKSGVAVNAEHLLAANKIADDQAEAFIRAVDSADGDPLNALVQALKVQRAVRGFVAEGARVTEANKLIKDEIAERVVKDPSTSRQLIAAMRGLDDPNNLNVAVQMAKGMDFQNKDEIRRFLQVILDMGEAEQKSRVAPQTLGDNIISAINTPKTVMASYDLSAPFRQGAFLSAGHPGVAAGASKTMMQALGDPRFARQAMREIQSSELAPLRKKAGLYFSDWENVPLKDREEAFMSNITERIPGIRASSRAYSMYLNKLRADVFDNTVRAWGGPTAKKESEYRALASFVNWATGRGTLGPLNGAAPLLNAMFFSPRLFVSRPQAAFAPILFAAQGNFAAAKVASGDLVKFVGAGMAILTLAQLGGAVVESDPRSSKFGKIEIGPHQIDIWAGFQPVARYTAQFITGARKTMGGDIIVSDGSGPFGDSRLNTAGRLARSKLAPVASGAVDVLSGGDFIGRDIDPLSAVLSRIIPLGFQQMHGAVEADKQDAIRGAIIGTLGLIGIGTVSIDEEADQPFIQNPFNTRTPVEIENARLDRDAPTVEGVKLGADGQRRYQSVVEESRNAALGNLLNDPTYIAANNTQKKDLWEKTSDSAAKAGRKAFGIELAATGKNQEEINAGLRLAVNNTPGNYEKAMSLSVIAQEGVISPEVKALYDSQRKPGELAVDEFLHGKELVDAWSRAPAWTIGTPAAWTAAKQARDQYAMLIKGMNAAERAADPNIQRFYETEASGWLKTLYEAGGAKRDKYVHESRKTIALDRLWGKFSDAVTGLP